MTGLNAESRPVFRSSDVKVAVVTASGKVTTKKYGSAVISCEVDGKTVNYYLAVSTKTAVRAMRYGYKQIGKKKYSQARRMDKNYYDYLNDYRIEEFKRLVDKDEYSKYTLTALAELCGFSSRTSFFRYFKKVIGITPNEYIRSIGKTNEE